LENERLIKQCQKKSKKAFDELYRTYSGMIYGICMRYTKNSAEAEDLLHDCFIKVMNKIGEFEFKGSFEGWLKRIAVNSAINNIKAKKLVYVDDLETETKETNCPESLGIIQSMDCKQIIELINTLPVGYKTVFNLYVVEGYKHKEIGEMLGFTENTSKTQFLKARKALMEMLSKLKEEDERNI